MTWLKTTLLITVAIAAAWAVMNYLGEEGYTRLTAITLETTRKLIDGIKKIKGLRILGSPDMTVLAFTSDGPDIYTVADALDVLGWYPDRQQEPPALHLMVTPVHEGVAGQFLADLEQARETAAAAGPSETGARPTYGMASTPREAG